MSAGYCAATLQPHPCLHLRIRVEARGSPKAVPEKKLVLPTGVPFARNE